MVDSNQSTEDHSFLSRRHLMNASKVLGWKSLDDGDQEALAAVLARAITKCNAKEMRETRANTANDAFYATEEGQCVLRQKAALEKINNSASSLLDGLRQYTAERGAFSDERDDFIHTLLDRIGWRDDEIRGHGEFDELRQTPSALEDKRSAEIFDEAVHYVGLVHFAACQIMDIWKQSAGRPSSAHNDLVIDLQEIVTDHLHTNHPRFVTWNEQPAAPQGPLCQMFEVALEAMGEERHSNPSARVRRALNVRQVLDDATADYGNSVVPTSFEDILNRPD